MGFPGGYPVAMMRKLTDGQCMAACASTDFGRDVIASAPSVAVILTQGWCPQWGMMKTYLEGAGTREALSAAAVFFVEYDSEPFFERFMAWKEDVLGNREVPYVRYYRDGTFVSASNFVPKDFFLSRLLG